MMLHSFRDPFQFYTRTILYPRYFSLVACTPGNVVRHMTSDFDVCEVDPGYANELFKRCAIWKTHVSAIMKGEGKLTSRLS